MHEAVRNVENHLMKQDKALKKRVTTPVSIDYIPEVDGSDELEETELAYYQSLIGILR